ncbi:MAG: protein sphX [Bacteroidetes bacterium]|nr:MAG: protein sphX [Bacteroidota bacterium]
MKIFAISILAMCAGGLLTSCNGSQQKNNDSELSGAVQVDGSSTVYPITEAVAEEFRVEQPKVKVTIGSSGSGAGFKKFARGETDISDASRAIKAKEVRACKENNIKYLEIRVALDGIAIVVNKNNSWLETITTEELKELWKPNSPVQTWSDIRPEWPSENIQLFGPSTAHGTYDFFTEEIVGESGASRSDYNAVSDYNVAVKGISTNENALGYFGLAYYTENKDQLKLIGVDSGNGAVLPSLKTVGDGTYSPLARPLFIYVNEKSAKRDNVREFVQFYIKNAAQLSKDVGYIPLSDSEYSNTLAKFNAFSIK